MPSCTAARTRVGLVFARPLGVIDGGDLEQRLLPFQLETQLLLDRTNEAVDGRLAGSSRIRWRRIEREGEEPLSPVRSTTGICSMFDSVLTRPVIEMCRNVSAPRSP
jgi:hypothetical protein